MKAIIFYIITIAGSLQLNAQCWQSISGGGAHSMGIKQDGTLWGWGNNNAGRLGNGTNTNTNVAIEILPLTFWQSISAGKAHTIAIKPDSTLWAWGSNEYGQLGDGTLVDNNTPMQIGTAHWLQVSAGYAHTIGIRQDGTLWTWGSNSDGQLGDGSVVLYRSTPVQIGTDSNWKSISTGNAFNLAIRQDGTLWAFGRNDEGELADGTIIPKNYPVQIGTDTDWKIVAAGAAHCMAIRQDGTLWTWGGNHSGQLGNGSIDNSDILMKIGSDTNWQQISGGHSHSMAIKQDGTLWVWGDNGYGQLGDGGPPVIKPVPLQLGIATDWQSISAGDYYSLALKQNGHLWAWGDNTFGQLGDGTNVDKDTFTNIPNCWPLNTSEIKDERYEIEVYPNPANTFIELRYEMRDKRNTKTEIYSAVGQLLLSTTEKRIDVRSFTKGVYYLKCGNQTKKIVIE